MEKFGEILVTVLCSVIASSGVWTFLAKFMDKKDYKTKLLLGLAHDRITFLGMKYLERGDWITFDEYENLNDYLFVPYSENGGNGSAAKVMTQVRNTLRIVPNDYKPEKM